MVKNRVRYRNTLLILVVSFGVALALGALPYIGSALGAVVWVVGWLVLAPLYFAWYSRRSAESSTATDAAVGSTAGWAQSTAFSELADHGSDPDSTADPVATLKRQYAAGELSETEFERRLEILLGVENLDLDDVVADERSDVVTDLVERDREGR